jgi:hypothetical protein
MKADVQAFKAADVYVVYLGFRCAYDLKPSNTENPVSAPVPAGKARP